MDESSPNFKQEEPSKIKPARRILLVNTEDQLDKFLGSLLESRSYSLLRETLGQKAIELVQNDYIDLIIVGEHLANIGGVEWIAKLRRINQRVKVVLISKHWQEANLYQRLISDLEVALIAHRPLKADLFAAQLEDLLSGIDRQTTGESSANATDYMQEFKRIFNKTLPARLDQLAALMIRINPSVGDLSSCTEARRLAHSLKGLARSSGLDILGNCAEALEKKLHFRAQSSKRLQEESWSSINLAWLEVQTESRNFLNGSSAPGQLNAPPIGDLCPRILIVADTTLAEKIAASLAQERIRTESLQEAAKIFSRLEQFWSELLLIDTSMPGLSAYDLCRKLRTMPIGSDLSIVLLTENSDCDTRNAIFASGADDYLLKPIVANELINRVQTQFLKKQFWQESL